MTIRVVLVDDVPEVRLVVGAALRLRGGFEIVGEAPDGSEAVRLATTLQPDIVVLDLGLPDITGRDVLTRVRELSPQSQIVVFSGATVPDQDWIAQRVEGYVFKDAEVSFLVDLLELVGSARHGVAVLDLPQEETSVRAARRFVGAHLSRWDLEDVADGAELVVSELVTNAIMHAGSACQLRLSLSSTTVRLEVRDGGAGTPEILTPDDSGEHGRGMHLIAALAVAWGMELLESGGKVVWAEVPRTA